MVLIRVGKFKSAKFKPGTVEKNISTIGPPAGIEPTPLRNHTHVEIQARNTCLNFGTLRYARYYTQLTL